MWFQEAVVWADGVPETMEFGESLLIGKPEKSQIETQK